MMQPHQQTLQQKRAKHAYTKIRSLDERTFKVKEYGSLVRGLPAQIQIDGLGAALAFLQAKGKEYHLAAYHHLEDWLRQEEQFNFQDDLLAWLLQQSTITYRQVASEGLAYLVWLKRFVEAKGWESTQNDTV